MQSSIMPAETRTLLENVRWGTYVELAEQRRGSVPRMTYFEGALELMSPRRQHENIGRIIGRMIETYSEMRGIEVSSLASTTFKRKDMKKGFEADESYYIQHAEHMRSKAEVDLRTDPPPDLVVEIEITSSAIPKMELFAAFKVPEVWRHDGERLSMDRLIGTEYESIVESVVLPGFTIGMAESILDQRFELGETALILSFRKSL